MCKNFPTAALWKRLCSTVYDIFILTALSFLYFTLATWVSTALLNNTPENYLPNVSGLVVQLGWALILISFYCYFWKKIGQTVAMKAWKLKLVTNENQPLTLRTCIVRALTGFIGFAGFGVTYLWMLVDKDKLALHDRLTKTRVIELDRNLS